MRKTYLTDEQVDYFRRRILAMRKEIADQVDYLREQVEEDQERAESDLDHLHHVSEVNHDVLSNLSTRDLERLNALDRVLGRIDKKTYGLCKKTGRPIPLERLEAIPYTDLSLEAERAMEET